MLTQVLMSTLGEGSLQRSAESSDTGRTSDLCAELLCYVGLKVDTARLQNTFDDAIQCVLSNDEEIKS